MKRIRYDHPESMVCPVCGRRGRVLQGALPTDCPGCDGTGYITVTYYRKLKRVQKQAHQALTAVAR